MHNELSVYAIHIVSQGVVRMYVVHVCILHFHVHMPIHAYICVHGCICIYMYWQMCLCNTKL